MDRAAVEWVFDRESHNELLVGDRESKPVEAGQVRREGEALLPAVALQDGESATLGLLLRLPGGHRSRSRMCSSSVSVELSSGMAGHVLNIRW